MNETLQQLRREFQLSGDLHSAISLLEAERRSGTLALEPLDFSTNEHQENYEGFTKRPCLPNLDISFDDAEGQTIWSFEASEDYAYDHKYWLVIFPDGRAAFYSQLTYGT